jgi:transcriptional regulator GlxA family with amidase domain
VPGFDFVDPAALDDLLGQWGREVRLLQGLAGGPTEFASVCAGAFMLGEAGLLDGHEATTAWLFAPELGRRYPRVSLSAGAMVVQDGRIATSAAFTAGLDLALRMIERHAGADVARATSRISLASPARRSQAPFVDEKLLPVVHARFSDDIRNWLRRHLAEPYDLTHLAAEFNVSTRTLLRRFADETGESPLSFLQRTRIAAAKRLLETSALTVHAILGNVGYRDASAFRRLFTDRVGMTPSDYRRQFQHEPGLSRSPGG